MKNEPQKEHEWLRQLVGEWTYESECAMEPGKPPETFKGSERVRALGGLWVLCEGRCEMPGGGTVTMLMTLGYDPQKQQYQGTWVGSMMTHLWVYSGSLDAEEKVLALDTEGPNCGGDDKLVKQRDVIEIKSGDQRVLTSYKQGEDVEWQPFMTVHYRRIK
jgi:hypothetical protein